MPPIHFVYFVAFAHRQGVGTTEVSRDHPLTSHAEVVAIGQQLQAEQPHLSDVTVTSFILLRTEPPAVSWWHHAATLLGLGYLGLMGGGWLVGGGSWLNALEWPFYVHLGMALVGFTSLVCCPRARA